MTQRADRMAPSPSSGRHRSRTRRLAPAALLVLLPGFGLASGVAAASAPAFVQGTAGATVSHLTFSRPVGAGDLLVAALTTSGGGSDPISGVSDSLGDAWTKAASLAYGNGYVELYYAANCGAGADQVTVAGTKVALAIAEYSGVSATSPLDKLASHASSSSPSAGPTAAIGGAGELVLGVAGMSAPGSFSAGTGFTLREAGVSNYLYAVGLEDALSASGAGQSMTMKATNSGYAGGIVAVFLAVPTATGPTAALALSPTATPVGQTVTASAAGSTAGSSPIQSYSFTFGDGTTVGPQVSATATHAYGTGGVYTVTVRVTDSAGRSSPATAQETVGQPAAAVTVTPSSGNPPLQVTASAAASTDPIGIQSYSFNFGDGTVVGPQPGASAAHTYTAAGTFTVMATVSDAAGATSTASAPVTVYKGPTAALSLSPAAAPAGQTVIASAAGSTAGSNPIQSYSFSFGDGTTLGPQSGATAAHSYSAGGVYTVTVTVSDGAGHSSQASAQVTVGQPTAVVTVSPTSGTPPLLVTASAAASTDPIGIQSYSFNFGDGTTVGPQTSATATHTYTTTGSYTVTATATDSAGATSTATAPVSIYSGPTAALSLSPTATPAGQPVSASAAASAAGSNPIQNYSFNFGDGTTVGPQPGASASHAYAAGGVYMVTVTVTDSAGHSSQASAQETVGQPTAALSVTPASGTPPLQVSASAAASTDPIGIQSYSFNFGDGAVVGPQTSATATHTYTTAGSFTVTLTVADSAGATASATSTVSVVAPPTATLTLSPTAAPAGYLVAASAAASTAGSNPIASYSFSFGDGTTVGPQPGATASHTYAAGGVYTVTVTVTDSAGYGAQATAQETVGQPTSALTVSPSSGSPPLLVTASAAASSDPIGIQSYSFSFGDGTAVGPQASPMATHTYTTAGSYMVAVTVADSAGATATATSTVSVLSGPTAALSLNSSATPAGEPVIASASASTAGSSPIASYTFSFGDGTVVGPQTSAIATHSYSVGGVYTVTVTVTDSAGNSSQASAQETVEQPSATLTLSPSSGSPPLLVTAGGAASNDPIGIQSYTFDFGDGTTVGPQTTATATHTYTAAGGYTVTLTVTDSAGATATATSTVSVATPPTAALSLSPGATPAGEPVTASAAGSTPGSSPLSSYIFSFGDGTAVGPQASPTATHSYSAGGVYTVTVSVIDGAGNSSQASAQETVGQPTAALTVSPISGSPPLPVTASASGSTDPIGIQSYTFSFGDGTAVGPQASAIATHTYTVAGGYTVAVTVTDSTGANSTVSSPVSVATPPTAALSLSPGAAPAGQPVSASAAASTPGSNPIESYTFSFGDGTTVGPQAGATATHSYGAGGVYTVTVTVTDSFGYSAQATAQETVGQPAAALTVSPSSGSPPLPVTASAAASTDPIGIQSYTFSFGDGTAVGPQASPTATHTYTVAGSYTVTLTVVDSAGATATASAAVNVGVPPAAALSLSPTATGVGQPVSASAAASTAGSSPIASYTFNFGDGTVIGPQTSATATHGYSTGGSYTVTVTVTDGAGNSAQATAQETVGQPSAVLAVSPSSGSAPLAVGASAAGSADPLGIQSYTFNFGDGTTVGPQAASTATHTYTVAGVYTVALTVTDSAGAAATATSTVTVYLVQDSFQRANQTGWGTASNGMTWSGTGSGSLSISGHEGLVSNSTSTSTFESLGSATAADVNGIVRFASTNGSEMAGMILRGQPNGNMDLVRYNGSGQLAFMVKSGGSWIVNQSIAAFTASAGTFYWLRFEVQGSNVYVKVWPSGATEPSAWSWSGTSSTITSAGSMGLYAYASTGTSVEFDSFSVAQAIAAPANSAIAGTLTDSVSGQPIAGVTVTTVPASTTTTTGASGTYSLPVAAGSYTVVFTASTVGYNANDLAGVQAPANGSATANQSLVAIPAQVAMDNFTQPNQGGGWSPSTDSSTWTSDIASPPNGVPINGAGITANQAWVDTSGSTLQDFDTWMGYRYANQQVNATLDITSVVSDPTYQHGARLMALVQGTASSWNAIVMTIDPPDGSKPVPPGSSQACTQGDISLWVTIPSTWTQLAMVCQTVSLNTLYHAQLEVVGNLVEGNLWTGSTEPSGWQISASQSLLQGAGQAGTRTTGAYVDWGSFSEIPITQISGSVSNGSTGSPVSGATLSLNTGPATQTAANGSYGFIGLAGATTYDIGIAAPGYTSGVIAVTTVTGSTATANVSLAPSGSVGSPGGGLVVSDQIQNGITNNPGNGQTETDVTWTDATGNGWRIGSIPGYGGANTADWYEVDGGVVGANQTSLNTTSPSDLAHDWTESTSGAFWGSESTPYAQVSLPPLAPSFRVGFQATVPAAGTDPNGFVHTVTTYIYPGNPGFIVDRFDITNPSSKPIQLATTGAISYDVISGLEQLDTTWNAANGGYGWVGSAPVQGWPSAATPGDPDYFYIVPSAGSGVSDGIVAVLATKLSTSGVLNPQIQDGLNSHRVKVTVFGDDQVFPANTTITFYLLQAITRNLTAAEAASIAADYLNPDTPVMTTGTFAGFSLNEGLYSFAASGNQVTFAPSFSSTVTERWLDIYKVTGYTVSAPPTVSVNGLPLTPGAQYVTAVDTANHVAYVKLLQPLVPGAAGSGQIQSGPITISG